MSYYKKGDNLKEKNGKMDAIDKSIKNVRSNILIQAYFNNDFIGTVRFIDAVTFINLTIIYFLPFCLKNILKYEISYDQSKILYCVLITLHILKNV